MRVITAVLFVLLTAQPTMAVDLLWYAIGSGAGKQQAEEEYKAKHRSIVLSAVKQLCAGMESECAASLMPRNTRPGARFIPDTNE